MQYRNEVDPVRERRIEYAIGAALVFAIGAVLLSNSTGF